MSFDLFFCGSQGAQIDVARVQRHMHGLEYMTESRSDDGSVIQFEYRGPLRLVNETGHSGRWPKVFSYRQRLTIQPSTSTIRLIVRDRSTDRYGTLDVPRRGRPAQRSALAGRW